MKNKNKKMIIKLACPERYYSKCYHDFLDSKLLNGEEKIMFLILKRFLDVKSDNGSVFPSIEKIREITDWGNQKIIKYIDQLVKKGIVKKIRQGFGKPNIYVIADYPTVWTCDKAEEIAVLVENNGVKPLTAEEHIAELKKLGYKVELKEKELDTAPSKEQHQAPIFSSSDTMNSTTKYKENQGLERYTPNQIHQIFDYNRILSDDPSRQQDLDCVMSVLYTAFNTTKPTIRIAGEDKLAMAVIGKLMKLDKDSILYAIDKFAEQKKRIKNPSAYMLTILYYAPEQYRLDQKNQTSNDKKASKQTIPKRTISNQRTYDYDKLEKELLRR